MELFSTTILCGVLIYIIITVILRKIVIEFECLENTIFEEVSDIMMLILPVSVIFVIITLISIISVKIVGD